MALEPGKRAEAVDRNAKLAATPGATNRRADWLALDPKATAAAPAVAAPALPAPALVVPAPAAAPVAAPAPAQAPAATSTVAPSPAPATAAPVVPPPASVAPSQPRAPAPATAPDAEAMYRNTAERLKALQKLRDTGVITEQEYQEKRREILKSL
jgi:hypothetical protein